MERLDVRVLDADAGHAHLRKHLARPDLQGGSSKADRIWQTAQGAVGVSESGYNTVDLHLNYQYRAFGVPGLGLKRGLAEDLVIAPYATALALMVAPEAACLNLQRMADQGFVGKYGFFEAIDYTPVRQRRGQSHVVVRSFMAHHQGMSLLALSYLLLNQPMQRRFVADRLFQAVLLLLQERIPKATTLFAHTAELADVRLGRKPKYRPSASSPPRIRRYRKFSCYRMAATTSW